MRSNRMTNQLNFIGAIAAYILHFFVNILGYVAHMFLGNDVIVARRIVKAPFVCWNVNIKGLAFHIHKLISSSKITSLIEKRNRVSNFVIAYNKSLCKLRNVKEGSTTIFLGTNLMNSSNDIIICYNT